MSLADFTLDKSDFVASQLEDIIRQCKLRECHEYYHEFSKKVLEAEKAEDTKAQQLFCLLGYISFPRVKDQSTDNFFKEHFKEIGNEKLSFLKDIVLEISDVELQARVADILWILKRGDYQMAELAIDAYIKSAQHLESIEPKNRRLCLDRIKRAVCLAASLGKKNHLFTQSITYIETLLDKDNGEAPQWSSVQLMEILLKFRQEQPFKYIKLAEKAAISAEEGAHWDLARRYWEVKAKWHKLEKKTDDERQALISAAEIYVKEAESALNQAHVSYIAASYHLQRAIEAFRKISNTENRREELRKTLQEYQQKSLDEMRTIYSPEYDISDIVHKVREEIKGKSLQEAFLTLAFKLFGTLRVSNLRQQVQERTEELTFQALMPMVKTNERGKVIARQPSIISDDPKEVEAAMRAKMFQDAVFHWQMQVNAIIEPARHQINLEHCVTLQDFGQIVVNNPFIPPGREYLYAKGLQAGLEGDFVVAAHLLIPQLENSIRYILSQKGIKTSGLDDYGIQNEHDINTLLRDRKSELEEIFGEDIVFNLEGLLVNRFGCNFRNQMAHGLMDTNHFFMPQISYLWWLTLHLCFWPIWVQSQSKNAVKEPSEYSDTEEQES